ncbi:hypothetical protein [Streptomyces sp. NPDC048392]|uniref:hypothetical protein n=1 Tax=Streptomyces sp. NPDC048392 TaxID=3365543 RepID=UPI003724499C
MRAGPVTTDGSDDVSGVWQRWRERRVATVSAPYGLLALTGTHWPGDHPEGQLPDILGRWTVDGGRWTVDGGRWAAGGGRRAATRCA